MSKVLREKGVALTRKQIEAKVMDPKVTNLGSFGIALVQAVKGGK